MDPWSFEKNRFRIAIVAPSDAPQAEEMANRRKRIHHISVSALREDFVLEEEIQAGFSSRGNASHLFGRVEGALNRYKQTVEEMIAW